MIAATWPRERTLDNQLMVLRKGGGGIETGRVRDLGQFLRSGDLLVVNDAATLPGSLPAGIDGQALELRLIGERSPDLWTAAVIGKGDWRQKTEDRPSVNGLIEGGRIELDGMNAQVIRVLSPRLIELRFDLRGSAFLETLYRLGKPIQYSYLRGELPLWSVQTVYGSRPWSVEMPSAGHALRWELLLDLKRRGVRIAWVTHAAGISSSGDPALDRRLPLAERYLIPQATVDAFAHGGRVIAVGTSVVRALEGNRLRNGKLVAGEGVTALRLGRSFRPKIVGGLLTGMHELGESHFRLLESFVSRSALFSGLKCAEELGLRSHEFGDSCLILPD